MVPNSSEKTIKGIQECWAGGAKQGKRRCQIGGLVGDGAPPGLRGDGAGPPGDGEATTSDDGGTPDDGAGPRDDCADTPDDGACTLGDDVVTPSVGVGTPGDDGGSLVLEDDARGALIAWAFRPPVLLLFEPDGVGSRSNNRSRNNPRRKLAGSSICWSGWKLAQIRRWICSRGSDRSYAWNTLFSSGHIVPSKKLGFAVSNSDLSTVVRSVV